MVSCLSAAILQYLHVGPEMLAVGGAVFSSAGLVVVLLAVRELTSVFVVNELTSVLRSNGRPVGV